jgi:hypothetical protein
MKKIMTSVTTWGELKPLVRNAGFDLNSLLAAENITKNDLVNDQAILPTTAFRLFLRPKQTKSGAPDRKECFAIIKAHIALFPEDKAKFSIDGKNVTQLGTAVVQDLVAKYCQKSKSFSEAPAEEVKEAKEVAPVKKEAPVKEKKEVVSETSEKSNVLTAIEAISSLEKYPSYEKVMKHLNKLLIEIDPQMAPEETEEESIAREAREMMGGY